jgi:NitT/TauT family transport system permease protein
LDARPATFGDAALGSRRRGKRRKRSTFWRIREDIPRPLELTLVVLSLVSPFLLWIVAYESGHFSLFAVPSPAGTAETGFRMLTDGPLLGDAQVSTQRVAFGFGLSLLVAVPLGLAMGTFSSMRALFEPAIALFRYPPATAFTMLFIIWFGLGEDPKIALVFYGTVFFNTLMIANVVWSVPTEMIKAAQTLGASGFSIFRKVILPHAVPGIIDAARVNLAAAWNLIIVAELIDAEEGLGRRIVNSQKFLRTEEIFVVIVTIGIIGVCTDIGLRMLRNRLAPWSQE